MENADNCVFSQLCVVVAYSILCAKADDIRNNITVLLCHLSGVFRVCRIFQSMSKEFSDFNSRHPIGSGVQAWNMNNLAGPAKSADHAKRSKQPLTAAGDKPLLGVLPDGLTVNPVTLPAIPDSSQALELLDLYFEVCVAIYKPLHRPTVDPRGLPMTKTLGHARVSTALSIFAVTTFHRQKSRGFPDDVSSLSDSDAFFRCSMALVESEIGGPHLDSAQARLVQVFYLLMTCRINQAWYVFGNLLQIISALAVHRRDRRKMHSGSSKPDCAHTQCRKRTFWSAMYSGQIYGSCYGATTQFS